MDRIDLLIPFSPGAISHVQKRISPKTILLGEKKIYENEYQGEKAIDVPLSEIASEVGGPSTRIPSLWRCSQDFFMWKGNCSINTSDTIFQGKMRAPCRRISRPREEDTGSDELLQEGELQIDLEKHDDIKDEILIDGVEALAMGAIAGGCNFLSFYPMSPSTAVAVHLAEHSKEFGIIVEQAEDEISAMNMGIGAWYAGARGLASTSGGGFALMVEGLSLAGMIESPWWSTSVSGLVRQQDCRPGQNKENFFLPSTRVTENFRGSS